MSLHNNICPPYDTFCIYYDLRTNLPLKKEQVLYVHSQLPSIGKLDVLDLACGTGNLSIEFSELGYNVTGIDISEKMLGVAEKKAKEKSLKIEFINQNFQNFNYLTDAFDVVICSSFAFNYILKEEDLVKVFSSIHKTLRKNGLFIFDMVYPHLVENHFRKQPCLLRNNEIEITTNFQWDNNEKEVYRIQFLFKPLLTSLEMIENHIGRIYEEQKVVNLLQTLGFEIIIRSEQRNFFLNGNNDLFQMVVKKI
jgi:ubiquinone/menaquinone biosynthesis C-methylase UbiE